MSNWNHEEKTEQVLPDAAAVPPLTHALSIREPYACLVASGWKNCEVRSVPFPRNRTLPVWIAIHSSLSRDDVSDTATMTDLSCMSEGIFDIWDSQYWEDHPRHRLFSCSEIIGAMRVVASVKGDQPTEDHLQTIRDAWGGRSDRCRTDIDPREWLADDGWNWIIDDVYRFHNPIVCKGFLNVWAMRPELAKVVNAQMRKAVRTGGLNRDEAYGKAIIYECPKGIDKKTRELYAAGAA